MNLDEFIDIPYLPEGRDRDGCDCWGLVQLVYRERLGIELPDYLGYGDPLGHSAASLIAAERPTWIEVRTPRELDAVLFRVNGRPHHIGLYVKRGWMFHSARGKNAVLERYTLPRWKSRIEGFYRYAR